MTNRIANYLPAQTRTSQASQTTFQTLLKQAQKQVPDRMRQVETFVREHPVAGIGAAFSIGIILGWVIKRR